LHQLTELPIEETPPALTHPLALFWFLPAPDASDWPYPDFSSFGIPAAGSPEDRELDIVFDS
jgi:hypothetical protein